ncbi:uromodulin-like [Pelobates cultripes]|uniref:Uromodulin-like n=1 Tax=Pelobates cultripes TaxID=61616 RepID=A0AAD1R1D7_PELCU|nr:uromodulin-like [Pelobates cultripes]
MGTIKYLFGALLLTICFKESFSQDAKACSDCNSTNAICETLSGYVKCSCKDGFVGDGLNCTKLVFCDSGTCCPQGYTWDIKTKTCKDINECASTSPLVNKCVPTTNCVNLNGIFGCTNAASPLCSCTSSTDCMNIQGNVQCADPCIHYEELDGSSRLYTINSNGRFSTDRYYFGWFRYQKNLQMKQGCVGPLKCGSRQPLSLWADPPAVGEGIKRIPLLVNSLSGCTRGANISVKACPGEYHVYKYTGLLSSDVYCTAKFATLTPPQFLHYIDKNLPKRADCSRSDCYYFVERFAEWFTEYRRSCGEICPIGMNGKARVGAGKS